MSDRQKYKDIAPRTQVNLTRAPAAVATAGLPAPAISPEFTAQSPTNTKPRAPSGRWAAPNNKDEKPSEGSGFHRFGGGGTTAGGASGGVVSLGAGGFALASMNQNNVTMANAILSQMITQPKRYEDFAALDIITNEDLLHADPADQRLNDMQLYRQQDGTYRSAESYARSGEDVQALINSGRAAPAVNLRGVRQDVINAIVQASERENVNLGFMFRLIKQESSFDPNADARTSSALGLGQFLDATWAGMQRDHAELRGRSRTDPYASALAVALFVKDNMEAAANEINDHNRNAARNNRPTIQHRFNTTDAYMCHFLGVGNIRDNGSGVGATYFLKELYENPNAIAANDPAFQAAARANRNVFYDRDGSARSYAEVYQFFSAKFGTEGWQQNSGPAMANNSPRGPAPAYM